MGARVFKVLAFGLAVSLLAGCTTQKKGQENPTAANVETVEETKLPIVEQPTKFTIWCNNFASRVLTNYGEQESWKEVQKRTGIELEFIHPTGAASEQFNIMMASGDYPDIIYYSWGDSLSKYVDKKVALSLNSYLGIMPNLRKLMEANETVAKQIKLADGTIAYFPQINSLTEYNYWDGYFVRQDWLDAVNEQPPETIDDWYRVLTAFKGKDLNGNGLDDEIPFTAGKTMMPTAFVGAFGILDDFYINPETEKVSFGALDEGFKEYVTTMHKWYSEGLIDGEYLNVDQKLQDEKMLNNLVGAAYMDNNNSMINYLSNKPIPEFDLTAVPMPSAKDGKRYYSRPGVKDVVSKNGGIITSSCSDPITAIKLLDYLYSDEACVLFNWGIENESYTVENGEYKYTDQILHNPDNKTPYDAIAKYCINQGFMKVYDIKAIRGLDSTLPESIKNKKTVSDEYARETDKTLVLPSVSLTPEEQDEYSKIKSEIRTYVDEMKAKYIMGKESLDSYDTFVENLKKMKAERAVEIMQTAYERYLKS